MNQAIYENLEYYFENKHFNKSLRFEICNMIEHKGFQESCHIYREIFDKYILCEKKHHARIRELLSKVNSGVLFFLFQHYNNEPDCLSIICDSLMARKSFTIEERLAIVEPLFKHPNSGIRVVALYCFDDLITRIAEEDLLREKLQELMQQGVSDTNVVVANTAKMLIGD